jgi:hypothetical protein
VLADWFDVYDAQDRAGRAKLLIDPRSPGKNDVSGDLLGILADLPKSIDRKSDEVFNLKLLAAWFDAHPNLIGKLIDDNTKSDQVQRLLRSLADRLDTAAKIN